MNELMFFRDFTPCNHPAYRRTPFTFTALLLQIRKALRKVQDKNCQSRKEVHAWCGCCRCCISNI